MNSLKTGTVTAWNDERGFGFVRPDDGSDDVFLHIKALPPQSPRPQIGQGVRYTLVLSGDGKPRAAGARLSDAAGAATAARTTTARADARGTTRDTRSAPAGGSRRAATVDAHAPKPSQRAAAGQRPQAQRPSAGKADFGTASLFWLVGFVLLYAVCSALWPVPWWVGAAYVALSVVAYSMYAADKRAAQTGAWRVPENNLHLVALLGGWPGALVAQQRLRHKTVKPEFRAVFWLTVVANVLSFVLIFSPLGQTWLHWA